MTGSWVEKAKEILTAARVPFERDSPLARLTTIGVGGPADFLLRPTAVPPLAQALEGLTNEGIPVEFVGAGSNLIISDEGFRGAVICLADLLEEPQVDENRVRVSAGWRLPSLVVRLTRLGLSGMEWAEGIPGSVGGSVRMNAGAFSDSMQATVREVVLLDRQGRVERRAVAPADFAYRQAPFLEDRVVVEARFDLTPKEPERIESTLRPFREHRRKSQPQGVRSSGCVFKNPPGGNAGKLVEEAGLKGTIRGGAKISEVHGNFIVNTGAATFVEVMALVDQTRETVARRAGIELELEVVVWP